jgi:hypothetical protein
MAFSPDAYRLIGGRNLAEKPAMGLLYSCPGLRLLKTQTLCPFSVLLRLRVSFFIISILDWIGDADNVTSARVILSLVER